MATAQQVSLEIVTPDGVKLSEQVSDLTVPSVQGEVGVLPGHRPLLAALQTGIVSFHARGEVRRLAVGPGFVQVYEDRAVLLSDQAKTRDEVDPVRVRLELKEVDAELDAYAGDLDAPEYIELVLRELWAAAQLDLYGDPPPPRMRIFHESLVGQQQVFEHRAASDTEE